jgi:hypothetical protein
MPAFENDVEFALEAREYGIRPLHANEQDELPYPDEDYDLDF